MKKMHILTAFALAAVLLPAIVAALDLPDLAGGSEQDPSHVNLVIYQIGLTHVTMTVPVEFVDLKAELTLPSSAILQTIRVTGLKVISMRLRQKIPQQLLVKGDDIIVHTQATSYQGIYEGIQEGYLIVKEESGSTLINLDAVISVEVSRAVSLESTKNGIVLEVSANASGLHTLNVSFLSRATSWQPTHFLELGTGQLETWAMVTSSENWSKASLTLIVGQPHLIIQGPLPFARSDVDLGFASAEWTVSGLEEYHAYKYARPFTISSGDTAMLQLLSGPIEVEKQYFWSGGSYGVYTSTPVELINVTNTLDEPIPEGIVQFYRGSEWVGNDRMPYVAVSGTAKLTVGYAHDLKVDQKTIRVEHLVGMDKVTIQLKATNYKNERVSMTIQQIMPYRATLESANPEPIQEGQVLTWTLILEAGDSKLITYTYSIPVEKP